MASARVAPLGSRPSVLGNAPDVFDAFREHEWIGNSRNLADEQVVRTIASIAGFELNLTHRSDGLDVVEQLSVANVGVGLPPANRRTRSVTLLPLTDPDVALRSYALTQKGRPAWLPLALALDRLAIIAHAPDQASEPRTRRAQSEGGRSGKTPRGGHLGP